MYLKRCNDKVKKKKKKPLMGAITPWEVGRLIAQTDFDVSNEETYKLLLHKIVELFVTVKGHMYTNNLMEKHNKWHQKAHNELKLYIENYMIALITR